jgi:simple sugar transport system permease protein
MISMDFITALLALSVVRATPVTLGALSGILCERTGIINIGIEGTMLMSAFTSFITSAYAGRIVAAESGDNVLALAVGVLVGVITGAIMGFLLGILSIRYKVDQIVGGTVLNLLAIGLTSYLATVMIDDQNLAGIGVLPEIHIPLLADLPVLGPILFDNQPITYLMFIIVFVLHVALFYTPWGLRSRAVGEHPRAADTVGINVNFMRYLNTTIGGMMAGLAGAFLTLESVGSFRKGVMTNGRGFIALAVMLSGNYKPINALLIALLFGVSEALSIQLQMMSNQLMVLIQVVGLGLLAGGGIVAIFQWLRDRSRKPWIAVAANLIGLQILVLSLVIEIPDQTVPHQILGLPPYILTIFVVAGVVGNVRPPAAEGKVYEKL